MRILLVGLKTVVTAGLLISTLCLIGCDSGGFPDETGGSKASDPQGGVAATEGSDMTTDMMSTDMMSTDMGIDIDASVPPDEDAGGFPP